MRNQVCVVPPEVSRLYEGRHIPKFIKTCSLKISVVPPDQTPTADRHDTLQSYNAVSKTALYDATIPTSRTQKRVARRQSPKPYSRTEVLHSNPERGDGYAD